MERVEVAFGSHGTICRAWRYAPADGRRRAGSSDDPAS